MTTSTLSRSRRDRLSPALSALVEAWENGTTLDALPEDARPRTPAEAYRLQARVADAIGLPIGGWKVGATNPRARKMLGLRSLFAGPVVASRILADGATLPGPALKMRGVECEIALVLGRDLPARSDAYTLDEVQSAVVGVRPAIEVIEPRWTDWLAVGAPSVIADLGGNGWLVVGTDPPDGFEGDPADITVELVVNDEVKVKGTGADAEGSPLHGLLWLANKRRTSGGLNAGDIVATGSCTGLHKASPGDRITARFSAIGEISLNFSD